MSFAAVPGRSERILFAVSVAVLLFCVVAFLIFLAVR
jgi:hypothetical protein